jgi:hypothetical protein
MFRALLVGVPDYRDDAFPALPFIDDDLVELSDALTACGYEIEPHERGLTDGDSIQHAIETFIVNAAPGETLLVYLSGHGVHYRGMDYLIPSTAMTDSRRFPAENCVPVTCDAYVENSAAATVVVIVDACREGIRLREKGPGYTEAWGDWERDKAVAQQVAYFYACSPGQTAGFSGEGFSVLSRALSQALRDESEPRTLAEVLATTQDKMTVLFREHKVRPHQARVRTDIDLTTIVVVPREGPSGDHPWVVAVRDHKVWTGAGTLRDHTTTLVQRLAKEVSRLPEDPWVDHEALALRMSAKVQWLVCTVNWPKLDLTPADAALLVAFPFIHQAYWARLAATRWPEAFDDPDFLRFRAGYPRLERRIASAPAAATTIERWLFLRWLVARPASYDPDRLSRPEGLAGEVFDPDRLVQLFRSLRMDPTLLADGRLRSERSVAASTDEEQVIHEQLLGFLLVAAHSFAIDPLDLSQVIVDHMGTGDPVDLAQLATTLAGARWEEERRSRSLKARCHHQAVHHALKLHAESVNALLVQIARIGPAALSGMPSHANAEQLEAVDGLSEGFRFRLAEDQIQELLMGEQLYGDPALAVRELYQNALDACRYRTARTDYLIAEKQPVPAGWKPRIEFRQGDEDGRPYLDCVDNGVGMGLRELTGLFAHAGVRFTTMPEYLEEEALWRRHGITLYPNSRFGIGVLSYFMLADEITVTTCRFGRDGRAGQRLEVRIAGPGTLSRVRDLGEGTEAGTTVRLYLRKTVSCVDILRRILWVSEVDVTAADHTKLLNWTAGQLSEHAPIGSDPLQPDAVRAVRDVWATSLSTLWWCGGVGAILADGLWAGSHLFGAVVNLTGPHMPTLTVDRRRIVRHDKKAVSDMLWAGIPDLIAPEHTVLTHGWLSELADINPRLADEIYRQRAEFTDHRWIIEDVETDLSMLGFFFADDDLVRGWSDRDEPDPEHVVSWRVRAWVEAGYLPGLGVTSASVCARPSDMDLLFPTYAYGGAERDWLDESQPVHVGHVIAVAVSTGHSHAEVVARLASLGYRTDHLLPVLDHLDAIAGVLVSADCDGLRPWLDECVPPGHVVDAALSTGLDVPEVVARLRTLGFDTSHLRALPAIPEELDLAILSVQRDRRPWLPPTALVRPGHVLAAALRLGMAPDAVAERLREFGHQVHEPETWPAPDTFVLIVTSENLDGEPPWLDPRKGVSSGYIAAAAQDGRRGADEVVAVLRALSFRTPEGRVETVPLDYLDRTLVGGGPYKRWLDPEREVPIQYAAWMSIENRLPFSEVVQRLAAFGLRVGDVPRSLEYDDLVLLRELVGDRMTVGQIVLASMKTRRSPRALARRYLELGIDAPEPSTMPETFDPDDEIIISVDVDGEGPWLDSAKPVPARHVLAAAAHTRRDAADVCARLRDLGYDVDPMPEHWDREDEHLLSKNLDGRGAWIVGDRIPADHLMNIWRSGRDVAKAARRLVELGMSLPDGIEIADQ